MPSACSFKPPTTRNVEIAEAREAAWGGRADIAQHVEARTDIARATRASEKQKRYACFDELVP